MHLRPCWGAYQENLRRFYRVLLPAEPQTSIERYVQDGIKRHREQVGAYLLHIVAASCAWPAAQPNGDRVRVWQDLSAMESVLLNLAGKQGLCPATAGGPDGPAGAVDV